MNLKALRSIADSSTSLLICIPSSVSWEDYQKELDKVEDWKEELNFKVHRLPKTKCERCYICHDGFIKGWMKVTGYESGDFNCTTTGKSWSGNFIKRSGPFHPINPIPCKSFRGFRYIYT